MSQMKTKERLQELKVPFLQAIDDQILVAQRDLVDARQELDAVDVRLVEAPGDENAKALEQALEKEIISHEAQIKSLERKKAVAARRDTVEYRREQLARLKAERVAIDDRAKRINALAADAIATVEKLHPILAELEALGLDQHADAWSIVRTTAPVGDGPHDDASRFFDPIADVVRGAAGRVPFINALFAAGVGRVGFRTSPWVEVTRADGPESLEESTTKADRKVAAVLDRLLAQYEAALKGAK